MTSTSYQKSPEVIDLYQFTIQIVIKDNLANWGIDAKYNSLFKEGNPGHALGSVLRETLGAKLRELEEEYRENVEQLIKDNVGSAP